MAKQDKPDARALGEAKEDSLPSLLGPDALANSLRSRGLEVSEEIEAPEPPVLESHSAKDLCQFPSTVKGAKKASVMFIKLAEPTLADSTKEGAKKFMVCEVFHEQWGEMLLTHTAIRADDSVTPLYYWLKERVKIGQAFRFASFETDRGYEVIRPIPVA